MELLREMIPKLTRVAVILPDSPASTAFQKETATPAHALQVQLIPLIFHRVEELERTSILQSKDERRHLLTGSDPLLLSRNASE